MPDGQDAGQGHLAEDRKDLDAQDDANWAVPRLDDPECASSGQRPGEKVSAERDQDVFQPHLFFQRQEKTGIQNWLESRTRL